MSQVTSGLVYSTEKANRFTFALVLVVIMAVNSESQKSRLKYASAWGLA